MRVVIQKPDMDTALAAMILGVRIQDDIVVVRNRASAEDLADPAVVCIEAGGSGQVSRGNYDHHDVAISLPPACHQAAVAKGRTSPALSRLVAYVSEMDVRTPGLAATQRPPWPSLSTVFSGMRILEREPRKQLLRGTRIFRTVLARNLDPFSRMPALSGWRCYVVAAIGQSERLARDLHGVQTARSRAGLRVGWLVTGATGALGVLYSQGCDVALALNPAFGEPPVRKITVAAAARRVDHLLPPLRALEQGWGGPSHGTIIASPRQGTVLPLSTVVEIALRGL